MIEDYFKRYSVQKLEEYCSRIQDCLGKLSDEQIWMRNSDSQNSIGNLVLHLTGNVRQWIGFGVAGQPDTRQRDAEFAARGGVQPGLLIEKLRSTVSDGAAIITALSTQQLAERTTVQKYTMTKLEAIYHVVEHFSGHTGQIIFATKLLTGDDLGFYRHLSKTPKNP